MSNLNYEKMIREVDELTSSEFLSDMELKGLAKAKPYTQEEALEMAKLLGKIYLVAHAVHCGTCQLRNGYIIADPPLEGEAKG